MLRLLVAWLRWLVRGKPIRTGPSPMVREELRNRTRGRKCRCTPDCDYYA